MTDTQPPAGTSASRTWLKIFGFLIALCAGIFLSQLVGGLIRRNSAGSQDSALAVNLRAAADQIRAQAPIKVDAMTTLNGAASIGDTIIYTMTLAQDVPTAQLPVAQAWAQRTVTKRACADPEVRKLIDEGGKMRWIYTDVTGDQFTANLGKCV